MSKRIKAEVTCQECGKPFLAELYRTIWLEEVENRRLVFDDKVNVFTCENCGREVCVQFPLLATHAPSCYAVWYEPYPDPSIDKDSRGYAATLGVGNYLADAPRTTTWEELKETILEFESGKRAGKPLFKMNVQALREVATKTVRSENVNMFKKWFRKG